MVFSKQTAAGGAVVLGGGAAATGVVLANRGGQETIGNRMGSFVITNDADYEKAFSNKGSEKWDEINTQEDLKRWCKQQYSEAISGNEEKDNALLAKVAKRCTLKIKQKLEGKVLLTSDTEGQTDDADWKIKIQNFKDYQEPATNKPFDLSKLGEKQNEIKSATDTDSWKKLRDWCKDTYEKNLTKETSNEFEIANKFCTKATVQDALHGAALPETDSEWTAKSTKASSDAESDKTKDDTLHGDLKKQGVDKNKELKNWCLKKYLENHDAKVKEGSQDTLLTEVKKWCVLTIKEKLGDGKTFEGSDAISPADTNLQKKMEILEENDVKNNSELLGKFKDWKASKTDATKQKAFRDWCQTLYPKHYKGSEDNDWKLAKKYCEKTS